MLVSAGSSTFVDIGFCTPDIDMQRDVWMGFQNRSSDTLSFLFGVEKKEKKNAEAILDKCNCERTHVDHALLHVV